MMSTDEKNDQVLVRLSTISRVRETPTTAVVVREPSSESLRQTDAMRRATDGHPTSSLHGQFSLPRGRKDRTDKSTANLQAPGAASSASTAPSAPQEVAVRFATNVFDPLDGITAAEDAGQDTKPEARSHPKATPGTCVVCLADREDVLDARWLHQGSFLNEQGGTTTETDCPVSVCLPCLKTYFEGIVAKGFDGVCPRMRCISCPRVVCERAWAPLVDPETVETFRNRARILLSFKCSGCHRFRDVMAMSSDQGNSYSSAVDRFIHNVASGFDPNHENVGTRQEAHRTSHADCVNWKSDVEAFCMVLRRYASGDDIDVARFYDSVEAVVFAGLGDSDGDGQKRSKRMTDILHCVEDSERRASLQLRYLRFHPMVSSRCCGRLHCFRCKISNGHPKLTCEQFEALRGVQDVLRCPQCGVHVVKSDGCDAITCVCLATFNWRTLLQQRNLREVEAFGGLYPEDPPRAAVQILRKGPPRGLDDEAKHVQEFRLASVFARNFPIDFSAARAAIFGDEHTHFTAQRAMRKATSSTPNEPQLAWGCFSHAPSSGTADDISEAEWEWQTLAARDWLRENREVLRKLRRQAKAARFALVEALYGDDSLRSDNHPAIAAVAAAHARDACRNASTATDQEPVVARRAGERQNLARVGGNRSSREMSQILRLRQEERKDPILELSASWRARPLARKQGNTRSSSIAVGSRPSKREIFHGLSFGSQCLEGEVELWVDASPSRAEQLETLVASAEERLSNAWVALWGRRQFKLMSSAASAPAVAEAGRDKDESEAVQAAARRCAFLEAYPEHACREQALMMEAFIRQNRVAVERAQANAVVHRVTAWKLMCKTRHLVHSKTALTSETVATEMSRMHSKKLGGPLPLLTAPMLHTPPTSRKPSPSPHSVVSSR